MATLKQKIQNPAPSDSIATRRPAETSTGAAAGIVAILFAVGLIDASDQGVIAGIVVAVGAVPALVTKIVQRLQDRF